MGIRLVLQPPLLHSSMFRRVVILPKAVILKAVILLRAVILPKCLNRRVKPTARLPKTYSTIPRWDQVPKKLWTGSTRNELRLRLQ